MRSHVQCINSRSTSTHLSNVNNCKEPRLMRPIYWFIWEIRWNFVCKYNSNRLFDDLVQLFTLHCFKFFLDFVLISVLRPLFLDIEFCTSLIFIVSPIEVIKKDFDRNHVNMKIIYIFSTNNYWFSVLKMHDNI